MNPNDLTNHNPIKRGRLYGAIVNEMVIVHDGSVKGYPDGSSVLWLLHQSEIDTMIALLKAIKDSQ